ncbi:MAG TPA: hypothetical protein DCZ94_19925 [Lentisphaeria bacterium]|nr:MAG: hypothetical protein A2X48_22240 [Lentisphaerae bacterium GWF2_49_21]HBC89215.1 hypothetical protein [Lentisphaeria bacterium]
MKVKVKDFQVNMEVKNNGIELDIHDNQDKHLGDLRIGKATIEWCKGQAQKGHGKKKSWDELIKYFEK